jgi:AcrR family transcriptional regulator
MTSSAPPRFAAKRRPAQRPGKAGSKRDLNRKAQGHALAVAALSLFLESGIEAVSIEDITRAAGVAKGSFYRYFDDKAALVSALVAPLRAAVREATERARTSLAAARTEHELLAAYRALAEALVGAALPSTEIVRLYLQESRGPASGARAPVRRFADDVMERAIELTRVARSRGLLRRDLPPEVTALAVVGAVETLFFRFVEGAPLGPPALAAEALLSMTLDGVRAASRRPGRLRD